MASNVESNIDGEEFNPIGTWVILLIYFGILVFMWIFMYFFEFLGRGPTVIR